LGLRTVRLASGKRQRAGRADAVGGQLDQPGAGLHDVEVPAVGRGENRVSSRQIPDPAGRDVVLPDRFDVNIDRALATGRRWGTRRVRSVIMTAADRYGRDLSQAADVEYLVTHE
jgi:hypothetical protein